MAVAESYEGLIKKIFEHYYRLQQRLGDSLPKAWLTGCQDIQNQLAGLIYPGFITATPQVWLTHYPRYLKAIEVRLDQSDVAAEVAHQHAGDAQRLFAMLEHGVEVGQGVLGAPLAYRIDQLEDAVGPSRRQHRLDVGRGDGRVAADIEAQLVHHQA